MLTSRGILRRTAFQVWSAGGNVRYAHAGDRDGGKRDGTRPRRGSQNKKPRLDSEDIVQPDKTKKASLIEQLFPEETKRFQDAAVREIPRLPLETLDTSPVDTGREWNDQEQTSAAIAESKGRKRFIFGRSGMRGSDAISVLVLRNASLNLVEEDFRRLIPQGRHVEGWKLEQGDIIKVVPGRDMATLAPLNFYYLLFSSKLSAFTYQDQVTRIARVAAANTQSSNVSPLPPPPGMSIDGMDAHAAIAAYSLLPTSQKMEIRQLEFPLTPLLQSIVRHQGYWAVVNRADKMPFEVRLTLEGPQLFKGTIRQILLKSGTERALGWSGGNDIIPKVTTWEPNQAPSPAAVSGREVDKFLKESARDENPDYEESPKGWKLLKAKRAAEAKRRTPDPVYVVGFQTESAAQTFRSFWHRRPMEWKGVGKEELEDDLSPIANVEMLW